MTAAAADIVEPLGYAEYGQRVRAAIIDSLLISFAVGALVFGLSVFAARGGPFASFLSTLAYLIYLAGATFSDDAIRGMLATVAIQYCPINASLRKGPGPAQRWITLKTNRVEA